MRIVNRETRERRETEKAKRHGLWVVAVILLFVVQWGCAVNRPLAERQWKDARYRELAPASNVVTPSYSNVEVEEVVIESRDPKAQLGRIWREARADGKRVVSVWPGPHNTFLVVVQKVKP